MQPNFIKIIYIILLLFSTQDVFCHINTTQPDPVEQLNERFSVRVRVPVRRNRLRNARFPHQQTEETAQVAAQRVNRNEDLYKKVYIIAGKITFISMCYLAGVGYSFMTEDNFDETVHRSAPLMMATWFGILSAEFIGFLISRGGARP